MTAKALLTILIKQYEQNCACLQCDNYHVDSDANNANMAISQNS